MLLYIVLRYITLYCVKIILYYIILYLFCFTSFYSILFCHFTLYCILLCYVTSYFTALYLIPFHFILFWYIISPGTGTILYYMDWNPLTRTDPKSRTAREAEKVRRLNTLCCWLTFVNSFWKIDNFFLQNFFHNTLLFKNFSFFLLKWSVLFWYGSVEIVMVVVVMVKGLIGAEWRKGSKFFFFFLITWKNCLGFVFSCIISRSASIF